VQLMVLVVSFALISDMVPSSQGVHCKPAACASFPEAHCAHCGAPAAEVEKPGSQSSQPPAVWRCPRGQAQHASTSYPCVEAASKRSGREPVHPAKSAPMALPAHDKKQSAAAPKAKSAPVAAPEDLSAASRATTSPTGSGVGDGAVDAGLTARLINTRVALRRRGSQCTTVVTCRRLPAIAPGAMLVRSSMRAPPR
jgi:hypothetical protein